MKNKIKIISELSDFEKVYKVFSEEPYNEKYTEEELQNMFNEYSKKGYIYGLYKEKECVGMCVIVKGVEEEQPVKFKNEKVMYLAELAVLKEFRRKGLGKSLILYGIMQSKLLNYEKMYMRTLEKGSMSYGIAKRIGFEEMENTYQYVERARTNGKIEKLKNIFLEFDLKNLNKDFLKKEIKSITNKEKGDEYERI